MQSHSVESSTLTAIAYDHNNEALQLQFRDGSIYSYSRVPADIYEALLIAPSKGKYFNSRIRGQFAHQRADRDGTAQACAT
jgi:hypothetical protein